MSNHLFTFILAGGSGERFWPLSRSKTPKHLLRLLSDQTLLETTVRRVENLVPWDRVFILTNAAQADSIRKELLLFLPKTSSQNQRSATRRRRALWPSALPGLVTKTRFARSSPRMP